MNRDQAKALLPIITAFAEGKTVQIRHSVSGAWSTREDYSFEGLLSHYRIKPEPRKIFVRTYEDGSANAYTQNGLDKYLHAKDPTRKEYVEFVEVIK